MQAHHTSHRHWSEPHCFHCQRSIRCWKADHHLIDGAVVSDAVRAHPSPQVLQQQQESWTPQGIHLYGGDCVDPKLRAHRGQHLLPGACSDCLIDDDQLHVGAASMLMPRTHCTRCYG